MPPVRLPAFCTAAAAVLASAAALAADPLPAPLLALHQRAIDDGECQSLPLLLANYKPTIAQLSATDTLYVLPCDFGVINAPSRVYVISTGPQAGVRPVLFGAFDQDFGWLGDDVLFNVAFDPQTRTLTAHEFFDPAGDCGYDGTWVWRDYAFAMVTYRFQGTCDHTRRYPNWPLIWQAPNSAAAPRPQVGPLPDFFQAPN
jgi:hypothetical protein